MATIKEKALPAVRPNVGLEKSYKKRLETMIERMNRSVLHWVTAAYRANTPEMAKDESPAMSMRRLMNRLSRYWEKQFSDMASDLAEYFATTAAERADGALAQILKKGGISVKFKMTAAMNDALQAAIGENIALIKSIPEQYLTQVQGMVMRSVQAGHDVGALRAQIQHQYGVTYRRAAIIARDQNNKASAVTTRIRHLELGITQARWQHSHGGKHPRPTHVKASEDRVVYNIKDGWVDPALGRAIWPGTEISCRCVAMPIIPALEQSRDQ